MSSGLSTPDFLTIGHICLDLIPETPESRIGGSAYYAATAAARLGYSVGVITAAGPESEALRGQPRTIVLSLDTDQSTTFENVDTSSGRRQILRHLAPAIPPQMVPAEWAKAAVVHLAPVAGEVPASMFRLFPRSLVGLTPQGY
ncbi:MAG: hypothetical protein KGJ86_13300, partial [Chloroflexota bacterium]|nr:hypothetical protein [Chloroflexota bacterium]